MAILPPIPFAAITLALGALGGVAGSQALTPEPAQAVMTEPMPIAQAALIETGPDGSAVRGRHTIRRAADGMFYVWAKVNGQPVRFLVDTGASVVVLTAADARAAGAAASAYSGRMQTASGRTAMAWTRLDNVVVGDARVTGLRAAVVRDGLGVSLLGANMLARLGSVRITGDRLELG